MITHTHRLLTIPLAASDLTNSKAFSAKCGTETILETKKNAAFYFHFARCSSVL